MYIQSVVQKYTLQLNEIKRETNYKLVKIILLIIRRKFLSSEKQQKKNKTRGEKIKIITSQLLPSPSTMSTVNNRRLPLPPPSPAPQPGGSKAEIFKRVSLLRDVFSAGKNACLLYRLQGLRVQHGNKSSGCGARL